MYDTNNIFAQILRKEVPCDVVYEDDKVLFFKDTNPQARIHILGIPKIEVIDFNDFVLRADKDMLQYFFFKIRMVIVDVGIEQTGFKVITNSGEDGGQVVPHFHIHMTDFVGTGENAYQLLLHLTLKKVRPKNLCAHSLHKLHIALCKGPR